MSAPLRWLGSGYPMPYVRPHQKLLPHLQPWERALLLEFNFAVGYVVYDCAERAVLLSPGHWLPVWRFCLNAGSGWVNVIGPRDFAAATGTAFEVAWRGACGQQRESELAALAVKGEEVNAPAVVVALGEPSGRQPAPDLLASAGDASPEGLAAAQVNFDLRRPGWCPCPVPAQEVYYCDSLTGAHGWLCSRCRRTTQTG